MKDRWAKNYMVLFIYLLMYLLICVLFNLLNAELIPICHLLALLKLTIFSTLAE